VFRRRATFEFPIIPPEVTTAADKLFRHKVIHLLKSNGFLSGQRIEILDAFRRSGFSVDGSVTLWPKTPLGA
jgi:hypothetical protein